MEAFNKVVRIGRTVLYANVNANLFCNIEFDGERLSITGVEGPMSNGDAKGGCGQIIMHEWDIGSYAPGWSAEQVAKFRAIWDAYHLNDMKAGSPAQRAWLDANPISGSDHYTKACAALEAASLNPDPSYLHDGKPYKYGSAWLKVEVPADALEFLASLPDTDVQPAWV